MLKNETPSHFVRPAAAHRKPDFTDAEEHHGLSAQLWNCSYIAQRRQV
ncbi:hypothetical protein G7A66_12760 [Altererythrobacter sp. SALINAS58]|nr:hypothetical protein [Alteripontixanthobacter muriae]NTZ43939.1 hypothetical protein [Alteripontixanthobacter muriae]